MINDLIREGWGYHDTQSERLAGELEAANLGELTGEASVHCLRLSNHTIGEHLGDWLRARRFAEAVRDATADYPAGFGAHLAVARYMDGDTIAAQQAEIECLGAAEQPVDAYLSVKSFLAGALAGTGRFADAGVVIAAANRLAGALGDEAASNRSMAVANNNLASELVEAEQLDADQARMMLDCAEAAHTFWKRCGTWVNEERALYLLALVNNRVANHASGLELAQKALGVIVANGEEPVDEAFIRLAAATSQIGLADVASAREQLATADQLAKEWSNESLVTWFKGERRKVATALANTQE